MSDSFCCRLFIAVSQIRLYGIHIMSEDVLRFDAIFNKVPGTITLTATHIAWNAKEPGAMDRQYQAMQRAISMHLVCLPLCFRH